MCRFFWLLWFFQLITVATPSSALQINSLNRGHPRDLFRLVDDSAKYLFAFGDSYTQTAFNISGQQPDACNPLGNPPLGQGTFSGGPNYIGWLTTTYNNSLVLTFDFARGGATISNTLVPPPSPEIPTFRQQVQEYFTPKYSTHAPLIAPWTSTNTIFTIFFGINDIGFSYQNASMNTLIPQLLDEYFDLCTQLHSVGARKFLFLGVPPLDRSPYIQSFGPEAATNYSDWVNAFNGQLAARVAPWAAQRATGGNETQCSLEPYVARCGDVVTIIYDLHKWMTGVLDDPTSYGFQDSGCSGDGNASCVWWAPSDYHTGYAFQKLMAEDMLPALKVLGW